MSRNDPQAFIEHNASLGVRPIERCCGTCRFSSEIYEDWFCACPAFLRDGEPQIDAGWICDHWEPDLEGGANV